jgi:hypothetical protein
LAEWHYLCSAFPFLFDISLTQAVTFQQAVQCGFNIPFKGRLCPGLLEQWNYIKNDVVLIPRANTTDQVVWALTSNKIFSTKSVYQFLERNLPGAYNKLIWKAKIPLKIKFFLWQLY